MIYNASAYEKENDPLIRGFLHFIYTNQPGEDDLSKRLSKLVDKCKENEKFRSDYLAVNLHDYDIRYEALQEGAQKKAIENAMNCLKEGDTPEKVARCIGLPLEEVKKLAAEITEKQ